MSAKPIRDLLGIAVLAVALVVTSLLILREVDSRDGASNASVPANTANTNLVREQPPSVDSDLRTDWSKYIVPLSGLQSQGTLHDMPPTIDEPSFETVAQASDWIGKEELVVSFKTGDTARAYPLRILIPHKVINDSVNGVPVVVSYCSSCKSAEIFDRRLDGQTLHFGLSELLYERDLLMWDDQTQSLWDGPQALVGELAGKQLAFYPSALLTWDEFSQAFPEGQVISRPSNGYTDGTDDLYLYTAENLALIRSGPCGN